MKKQIPMYDMAFAKINREVGIKVAASVLDTFQRVELVSLGEDVPKFEDGTPKFKVGDKVIILKYEGDNDTPQDILDEGYCFVSMKTIISKEIEE